MALAQPQAWFQPQPPGPAPEHQHTGSGTGHGAGHLFCFPHAGGGTSVFHGWGRRLPGLRVWTVRYPGRGPRLAEPLPDDLQAMAREAAAALARVADGQPVYLFGHSMGALVAFEAARALTAEGMPPRVLFASGVATGGRADDPAQREAGADDQTDHPGDEELIAHLRQLGGMPEEVLESEGFLELVLPAVRADGAMFRRYRLDPAPPLPCPIISILGDEDMDADTRPWDRLTSAGHSAVRASGGHFYLIEAPPFDIMLGAIRSADRMVRP